MLASTAEIFRQAKHFDSTTVYRTIKIPTPMTQKLEIHETLGS